MTDYNWRQGRYYPNAPKLSVDEILAQSNSAQLERSIARMFQKDQYVPIQTSSSDYLMTRLYAATAEEERNKKAIASLNEAVWRSTR